MAGTQFFIHHANTANTAPNLPTASHSTITAYENLQAQSINSSMNTTEGTSQATLSTTYGTGGATSNQNYFIGKWVSDLCINQSSIASGSWTWAFAAKTTSTDDTWPVDSTADRSYVCLYVWRPSTSAVVGKILDGFAPTSGSLYVFASSDSDVEIAEFDTFSGSAVTGIQQNDVLVFEAWGSQVGGGGSATDTISFYYDGTNTADLTSGSGTTITSAASFLTSPSAISLTPFVNPVNWVDWSPTPWIVES